MKFEDIQVLSAYTKPYPWVSSPKHRNTLYFCFRGESIAIENIFYLKCFILLISTFDINRRSGNGAENMLDARIVSKKDSNFWRALIIIMTATE